MKTPSDTLSSPQGQAFRAEIAAEPDEPAHRLIFADWLEDHARSPLDRAQVELIRVQFALKSLDADSPLWWDLRSRERILLATWHQQLAGPVGGLVRRYRFHRGFVESVEVDAGTFAQQGETIRALAPVRSLALVGRLEGIHPRLMHSLQGLDLRLARPDRTGRMHLARLLGDCPLHSLELPAPFLGQLSAYLQSAGQHLKHLGLGSEKDTASCWPSDPLRSLLRNPHPPQLTSLRLPSYGTASSLAAFVRSPWLASLRTLTVNGEGPGGMALLERLAESPNAISLRSLTLDQIDLNESNRDLGPNLRLLRELNLGSDQALRERSAARLLTLGMYQLRALHLRRFVLWYDGIDRLFDGVDWPHLHTLEIEVSRHFTRIAYGALITSEVLASLRRLTLTRMAPSEVVRLMQGQRRKTTSDLRELCLRETWFDGPSAHAVAASRWLPKLNLLEATGLHLDPANLFDVLLPENYPHLSWLDLRGENLSADLAGLLRERFGTGARIQSLDRPCSPYHLRPLPVDDEGELSCS